MAAPLSPALFDQFARGWRGYVLIALIALASSLMGATRVQVMDDDEAQFALATREFVEHRVEPRTDIAAHRVQAAFVSALRPIAHRSTAIWPYRLPSALGIAIAALATLWAGAALVGPRSAFFGAVLFSSGMLVGFEGMLATGDAMALGVITLAFAALAHLRTQANTRRDAFVFWLALACALAISGPGAVIIIGLALLALAAWERRVIWLAPVLWWPALAFGALMILLLELWVAPHAFIGAPGFAETDHNDLRGFYLFLLPFLIFPATYALPAAARLAWEATRAKRDEASTAPLRFLVAWALPTTLIFEFAPAKFAHDALPAYPAIALLCGAGLTAMRGRQWRSVHPAGAVLFAVTGAVIIAFTAMSATFMPGDFDADLRRAVSAGLIAAGIVAAAITALIMLRRPAARAAILAACALMLSFSLRERLLPEAGALNVSSEAIAVLTRARLLPNERRPLWVVGYNEPSLTFLLRNNVHFVSAAEASEQAREGDGLIVEGRVLQEAKADLGSRDLAFTPSEEPVRGLALGRGDRVALFVGAVSAAADAADGQSQSP